MYITEEVTDLIKYATEKQGDPLHRPHLIGLSLPNL